MLKDAVLLYIALLLIALPGTTHGAITGPAFMKFTTAGQTSLRVDQIGNTLILKGEGGTSIKTDRAGRSLIISSPLAPAGRDGATWHSGSGAPTTGRGNEGDYYFRTDTGGVYRKTFGVWGAAISSLKGTNGSNGAGVPTGGLQGQILAKASATDFHTFWIDPPAGGGSGSGGGGVSSVFGRGGAIWAQTGDYDTSQVPDTFNKRYITDAQRLVLQATSGVNSGNENTSSIGGLIASSTAKPIPNDNDRIGLSDFLGGNILKNFTWANLKTAIKGYFDSIYHGVVVTWAEISDKPTFGTAATKDVGSTAGTVAAGNDARLSDSRNPNAHAASHSQGAADPITVTTAQVTGLDTALAGKQGTLANSGTLAKIGESGGLPLWNGAVWPGGGGGGGGGDMFKAVYDPTGKNSDAFARGNHTGTQNADTITDGTTNKAYTATEKTKLAAISGSNTGDDATSIKTKLGAATDVVDGYLSAADHALFKAKQSALVAGTDYVAPTGNVASATKLQNARQINGVPFDGTQNITVYDSTKVPTTTTVNGKYLSTSVTLEKSDIGLGNVDNTADLAKPISTATQAALNAKISSDTPTITGVATFTGSINAAAITGPLTGNASTATKLQTARTINGVSFDGSAPIIVYDGTKEPAIPAGTSDQYIRGDKTLGTFPTTLGGYGITDAYTKAQTDSAVAGVTTSSIGALQAGDVATYVIAPYGATYKADYYCSATDCKTSFQMVFDAIKASGKGGEISLREGTYLFAYGVDAADADTVKVKGVGGVGMWAGGGTIFKRTANVTMFNYSSATKNPRACQVEGIHFVDQSAGYTAPVLKYHNAHNMAQIGNYFDTIPQAIYADRAWDFWTSKNNFRNCGTGATASTACVTAADGNYDQVSGWKVEGNRWESRPGTSFLSDSSGAGGTNNNISFVDNKFEGVNGGQSYPAIAGAMNYSRVIGNYVYGADTGYSPIDINGDDNTVIANHVQSHKEPAIKVNGWYNNVQSNQFRSAAANLSGHIQIVGGATGNRVANNIKYDPSYPSIPMILDGGTGTVAYRNTGAENNAIANLSDWPASVNATELGYLDGVTSAIQTQLNGKPTAALVTSVGSPGLDTNVPSEKAVRDAVAAAVLAANSVTPGGSTGQIQYNNGGIFGGLTTLKWDATNSRIGVGTASPTYGVHLYGPNAAESYGTIINRANPSATSGVVGNLHVDGTTTTASTGSFAGALIKGTFDGTGTLASLFGANVQSSNNSSGTVTSQYSLGMSLSSNGTIGNSAANWIFSPTYGASAATTSHHGVRIDNQGSSKIFNSYGIRVENQSGSTGTNYAIKTGTGVHSFGDAISVAKDVSALMFTPTIPAATTYGATTTIDLSLGDSPSVTLTGNPTLAFSNPKAGQWHRLNLVQDATGSRTVTWPSTGLVCTWRNTASNAAPTLLTGANKVDTIIIHTLSTTSAECWTGGNK